LEEANKQILKTLPENGKMSFATSDRRDRLMIFSLFCTSSVGAQLGGGLGGRVLSCISYFG